MRRALLLVVALTVALAGCGGAPGDLIAIDVTGGPANREQRIVLQDNGHASCNDGPSEDIGSDALIQAREIERELMEPADRAAVFEQGAGPDATSYAARTNDGTVRWREGARGLPPVLPKVQLFALQQGRTLC
jgi:hypothetical protein